MTTSMGWINRLAIGATVLAVICLLSTPTQAQSATTQNLYKTKCAACHGLDGKGQTAAGKKMGAHDFASPEVQKATDTDLADIIAKGKNKMPGYAKSLKPDEIKELVEYIRDLPKKK
ncbi:MAG TPA: cytochrome c [Candidatus Dormibacteraeota bacterium]|nr:cytochrome c [Candidatus Dormibacteraeota bacterium]